MNDTNVTVVTSLDAKIRETEAELETAKVSAARIPVLSARLEHLRETRALYADDTATPASGPKFDAVHVNRDGHVTTLLQIKGKPIPGSLGDRLIRILAEIPTPAFIKDIQQAMASKGPAVDYNNLSSQLSQYVKRGWIVRPSHGYYALPDQQPQPQNGTH
jgi:hypothetical protein